MVRHTPCGHERALFVPKDASHVGVQSIGKIASEQWGATLRAEDQMIMQACE